MSLHRPKNSGDAALPLHNIFGPDDDDNDDYDDEDTQDDPEVDKQGRNLTHDLTCSDWQRCISYTADECVLHILTCKHWSRSNIPLSERVVALPPTTHDNLLYNSWYTALVLRLRTRGLVSFAPKPTIPRNRCDCMCDAAILFQSSSKDQNLSYSQDNDNRAIKKALLPGGILILTTHLVGDSSVQEITSLGRSPLLDSVWDIQHAEVISDITGHDGSRFITLAVLKRPCLVNTKACPWKLSQTQTPLPKTLVQQYHSNTKNTDASFPTSWLQHEQFILAQTTISPSVSECLHHGNSTATALSSENIKRCVAAIQTHGFCIIRNLFHTSMLEPWTRAALQDLDSACHLLKNKFSVDLLHPTHYSQVKDYKQREPLSYKELSMREDFRVDLRDGPSLQSCKQKTIMDDSLIQECNQNQPTIISHTFQGSFHSLRFHPNILQIIRMLFNPKSTQEQAHMRSIPLYKGNYGRWNFDGTGPDGTPQPLRVGQIGSILSLPQAADQAIHADTPHLFEHIDCLPSHYANLFIVGHDDPSCSLDDDGNPIGDSLVGGTAFIHGTHHLSVCASLTATSNNDYEYIPIPTNHDSRSAAAVDSAARMEMYARIVRPSLQAGDALIFDCRVLHFGLANHSNNIRRPLLYVNMTQGWFHDPKNWDDQTPIFD